MNCFFFFFCCRCFMVVLLFLWLTSKCEGRASSCALDWSNFKVYHSFFFSSSSLHPTFSLRCRMNNFSCLNANFRTQDFFLFFFTTYYQDYQAFRGDKRCLLPESYSDVTPGYNSEKHAVRAGNFTTQVHLLHAVWSLHLHDIKGVILSLQTTFETSRRSRDQ